MISSNAFPFTAIGGDINDRMEPAINVYGMTHWDIEPFGKQFKAKTRPRRTAYSTLSLETSHKGIFHGR